MQQLVEEKLDRLIDIFQQVSTQYKWEGSLTNHFAALTYTLNNIAFDKEKIEDVRKHIKDTTGAFSNYRGTSKIILSSLLASQYDNPKCEFDKMLNYDKKMKEAGFKNNMYLPIANYALLATCGEEGAAARIEKAKEIYTEMKNNHPWLTGGDDYPLAILLANSNDSVNSIVENMEECYNLLNENGFGKNNGLQLLSHILGFRKEDNKSKVLRCKEIFDKLKENKMKVYSTGYAIIGFLSILGDNGYEAVDQVIEVVKILKSTKKYKWLSKENHLYTAAALVSDVYIENIKDQKDLIQTTIGISIEALIAVR
ncbi:DUF4003 domain-containing protein [Clostridium bowmanii]|uniref:DUF4003 family protein n=1 Tax=Clostridium bowmanii TaxID=132925 RepID=UPI001C0AFE9B|nr:DUF4003 family protein [Clostridium bowmanii]MBU3191633.1 DUF4003 domain-containing protein [Clostridium bowmanii]MCA1073213.1 DUF4003 domain-containing protein [Clostridium bowmanii]